ncbi:hypothetical protein D3C73_1094220 [compost metagenome]
MEWPPTTEHIAHGYSSRGTHIPYEALRAAPELTRILSRAIEASEPLPLFCPNRKNQKETCTPGLQALCNHGQPASAAPSLLRILLSVTPDQTLCQSSSASVEPVFPYLDIFADLQMIAHRELLQNCQSSERPQKDHFQCSPEFRAPCA